MSLRHETNAETKPPVMRLSLFDALDGGAGSPSGCDARFAPLAGSRGAGASESSLSETGSSHEESPATDEHPAVAASRRALLRSRAYSDNDGCGLDDIPARRHRRRRDRVTDQQDSMHVSFAASESPVRGRARKEMMSDQSTPLASSSSPVRARVGPRGIMGTDASSNHSLKASGDASTRGLGTDAASRTVPGVASGDASDRVPPSHGGMTMNLMIPVQTIQMLPQPQLQLQQQQSQQPQQPQQLTSTAGVGNSPMASEPCSPCRPKGTGSVGIMSTIPPVCISTPTTRLGSPQNGATPFTMTASAPDNGASQFTMTASAPDFVPTSAMQSHEIDVLKSMFGASSLPSGEDLDAMLLAAAPEVYED